MFRFLAGERDDPVSQSVQTASGAQQVSYLVTWGALDEGKPSLM